MTRTPTFLGLAPWEAGIEIIECETPDGVVDMYNYSTLWHSTLTCDAVPVLSFSLTDDERDRAFLLEFRGVQNLVFKQEPRTFGEGLWVAGRVKSFCGVVYSASEEGPLFDVETIVGDYRFMCDTVQFRWGAPGSAGTIRRGPS